MRALKNLIVAAALVCTLSMVSCAGDWNRQITSLVFRSADNPGLTTDVTGTIVSNYITATTNSFCPLSALKPVIEVSPGATVSPASGAAQDFTHEVTYTVTASNGSTSTYGVRAYNGVVTLIAGKAFTTGTTDATGTAARFNSPFGVVLKGTDLFITDNGNYTIRKMNLSTGAVTTVAGSAGLPGSTNGIGDIARFNYPDGITTDGTDFYIADGSNGIRKLASADYNVTTLGAVSGLPRGITIFGGNLYIAVGSKIERMPVTGGAATTIVNLGANSAAGIATDGTYLYVTDTSYELVLKAPIAGGSATTLAGQSGVAGMTDGIGTAATFNGPVGIAWAGSCLYVADTINNTIRRIDTSTGAVISLIVPAGSFEDPWGIASGGTNILYTVDQGHTVEKVH